MDRSGIMEIRKLFSKYVEGESAAGNLAGFLITFEKEIKGEFCEKLLIQDDRMIRKLYTIFRKALPNNHTEIVFRREDREKDGIQFLLDKLRGTGLESPELLHVLYEKLSDVLPEGQGYMVFLLHYTYSVPIKTSDRLKLDGESEEDYPFIITAVCPLKTDVGSLGFDEDQGRLMENPPIRKIDAPSFGFLFPSFIDRSADDGQVMCFRTEKLDIAAALFGQELPKIMKPERKKPVSVTPAPAPEPPFVEPEGDEGTPKDQVIQVQSLMPLDLSDTDEEGPVIPSLDTGSLNTLAPPIRLKEETEETPEKPEKDPDGEAPAGELLTEEGLQRKRPKSVRISGDRNKVIKRIIDGQEYFLVPVAEAMLE